MIVRKLRMEKGWSQEDLAQLSGLSVRTIQRVEQGKRVGPETMKCLAAVFETDFAKLMQENIVEKSDKTTNSRFDREEGQAIEYVRELRGFHMNWISFLIVIPCLFLLNRFISPETLWVAYVVGAWLVAIALHGAVLLVSYGGFGVFSQSWERRQIEKRLKRGE